MYPITINGDIWNIRIVPDNDISLIDRTGKVAPGTTDPITKTINIARSVVPPLFDKVLLHEIAHAVSISYGLLPNLHRYIPKSSNIPVEEWSASFIENHSIEISALASRAIGRPLCISGYCFAAL